MLFDLVILSQLALNVLSSPQVLEMSEVPVQVKTEVKDFAATLAFLHNKTFELDAYSIQILKPRFSWATPRFVFNTFTIESYEVTRPLEARLKIKLRGVEGESSTEGTLQSAREGELYLDFTYQHKRERLLHVSEPRFRVMDGTIRLRHNKMGSKKRVLATFRCQDVLTTSKLD